MCHNEAAVGGREAQVAADGRVSKFQPLCAGLLVRLSLHLCTTRTMALCASSTLLALLVAFCTPGGGWTDKPLRSHHGKPTSMDKSLRESWEPSILLDGRPVVSGNRPMRTHRYARMGKESRSHLVEDVDPEWVNLDGFAVLSGAPVSNSSTGPVRSTYTAARNQSFPKRANRVNRTAYRPGASNSRTHWRRAPQSSSGPHPPERFLTRTTLPERRQQHNAKPQSDQRNRYAAKLTSESVHVVSLQAQKVLGQSAPANRAAAKLSTPEPPEYEAKDISVRVMSPKSVLISWIDPLVEMGKVESSELRSYTVRYREKGESARWEYRDSAQRRLMIDTLYADSMYEFAVRISQGGNEGKWSVSVFQRTPESAPSGPPENFEVKPLRGKGTAVTATWDPPEETNGRIREYILSYAPALKPFGMKTVTYRSSTTTATIDGLTPGERYIFKIKATNRRGQGPQSKAFTVIMPASSSAVSSFSRNKASQRMSHNPSKYDDSHDKSDLQSTEEPEEPTTPSQPRNSAPVSRRGRPLSQTRSYHSIFSSVRGSVRGGPNRASTSDADVEDEDDRKKTTTLSPEKEMTTMVMETKEPHNEVSPESEDEIDSEVYGPSTPETPSLKVFTLSPTKPALLYPQQRKPMKLRLHQRGGVHTGSSASASSSSSLPLAPKTPSSPFTIPESDDNKKNIPFTNQHSKVIYNKPSTTDSKPTIPVRKENTPQPQTEGTAKGSISSGRTIGSGLGTRYGYGRRNLGLLFRGNSTRMINGYRPSTTLLSRLPSRIQHQATSQSTLPDQSQSQQTSDVGNNNKAISDPSTSEKSLFTLTSTSNSADTNTRNTYPSVSQSTSHQPNSTPNRGSQISSYNQDKSRILNTSPERSPLQKEAEETKVEEPTSSYKEDSTEETDKEDSPPEKATDPRIRARPSLAERLNLPGRFGSGTRQGGRTPGSRVSSSIGAGRPIVRIPTKDSETTGSASVSSVQETSDSPTAASTRDSLKNKMVVDAFKHSLTSENADYSDSRTPTPSSPSSSSARSSNSDARHSISEPIHRGTSNNNNNYNNGYLDKSNSGINKHVAEPSVDQMNPVITSTDPHRNTEENESVATRETPSRTSLSSGVPPSYRRPNVGGNGRIRSPLLATRQFGGSRLPTRSQQAYNSRLGSSTSESSSSSTSSSSTLVRSSLTTDRSASRVPTLTSNGRLTETKASSLSPSSARDSFRGQATRSRYPILRGKTPNGGALIPANGNGKNEQPNLTAKAKESPSHGTSKSVGKRLITGPDGNKWIVDLELGILMNQDGKVLQDSHGKPKRVVLGEDGHTIFDHLGSPLLTQEGMALFGHGRDSRPVVNPKEKILMVGGKPLLGLDLPRLRTTTTTTTRVPTTTPEPTTTIWTTEAYTTEEPYPTCPPGTFSKTDDYGDPMFDSEGILNCYTEDEFMTTLPPPTTTIPPTTTTTTSPTTEVPTPEPDPKQSGRGPSSEFDLSGKKRFTASYVNYIQKDPGAPCSLTEALEYLQVDILEDLIKNDSLSTNQKLPPKHKPHNLTVVAMEGCHSFIILDWGRPLKGDMVSGYMVYSASYDDVLNNRWSSKASSGTHLAVENLKPNSRYYFKVQAKNVFGLGPVSDTLTYVTESDDPLLIERPPGGEPIWVPFSFRYNPAHSSCKGSQYVKRTWYRKFVGVVLCNSLRYKIFMGDGLREPFYSIGDTFGQGEDHCQFVDSYRDGRTGPAYLSSFLPSAQGFYRAYRQQPVTFGVIGRRTSHPFVGWYECGVPIPGKW
ncbi:fibronectin type III domain-containing protein 1 isoform X2 [Nerophis lumbriciformis]|uniref:fibronectin type III domain-containing protein 1 isoform X2 n=1 Tax=Nerophis lumbriciformis TaxID=546530 RepID=UPI003BAD2945